MQKENTILNKTLKQRQLAYEQLQKNYKVVSKTPPPSFSITQLSKKEEDYLFPFLSTNNKRILFQQDKRVRRKTMQRFLKLVSLRGNKLQNHLTLYETPPVREKKGEIPFVYDWNGSQKIALLTRVKGQNTIHYFKLQGRHQKARIEETVSIRQVTFPQVLGPPSLSPDGTQIAFIHKTEEGLRVVVHNLATKENISTSGGGDTLRAPAWSPDSKNLFFPTNDRKGIIIWKNLKSKQIRILPREIYGRYISCSPDGKKLAFFQNHSRGKVNLCLWKWRLPRSEIKVHEYLFRTIETCNPQWSSHSQYLCFIERGTKDKVLLMHTSTEETFPIFARQGRVTWIFWNSPGKLIFSYSEGLYARPFIVSFKDRKL